ncbi:hypothetical protein A8926_5786 [Saccharopolyspora spinosa]|uniref:Uncharacterized protein n=1 Tax=Saccharopolyspora spinosa TaxID=60894 RepID=A0A2N3Y4L7_SACSN|nr:hypothetical protein A8926_5786 [Saccharopolyspora spinosa]
MFARRYRGRMQPELSSESGRPAIAMRADGGLAAVPRGSGRRS